MESKKKNRYVIDRGVYEKHLEDKVHLYGLLHQLAARAERIQDEEDVFHLLDAVKTYGKIADGMFDSWGIPGRYLVFGDKKDLDGLREQEVEKLSSVLTEHDAEQMAEALEQASWNLPYIIHGSSFRMLVGSIYELLGRYLSLARKVTEAKTEKDFLRLKKRVAKNGDAVPRMCRSWGVPEDLDTLSHDILEKAVRRKHLIPVREADLVLVCGEDGSDDPDGTDGLDGYDEPDNLSDLCGGWDE